MVIDGELNDDKKLIKDHIQCFYENLFRETEEWRPTRENENLKRLSEDDKEWLQRPFSMEELEVVIKFFKGDKALGPDGFNLYFIQKCWNIVKNDVWKTGTISS